MSAGAGGKSWHRHTLAQIVPDHLDQHANGEFPHPFFIVADAAYTCTESVLTPFHNKTDKDKDAYDYFQLHCRINVECALGMLQRRFGVFWRELAVPLDKVKYILHACMVLHNLSLDEKRVPVRPAGIQSVAS